MKITLEGSKSLNRPVWTQDNLYAYKDKRISKRNKLIVLTNYYEKSKGLDN